MRACGAASIYTYIYIPASVLSLWVLRYRHGTTEPARSREHTRAHARSSHGHEHMLRGTLYALLTISKSDFTQECSYKGSQHAHLTDYTSELSVRDPETPIKCGARCKRFSQNPSFRIMVRGGGASDERPSE